MNALPRYSLLGVAVLSLAALFVFVSCSGEDGLELPVTPTFDPALLTPAPRPGDTPVPTATSPTDILFATLAPNDLYGPARLQLLAYSVPGSSDERFTAFATPVISSNGHPRGASEHRTIVGFIGYDGLGNASIYYDVPTDHLEGSPLNELAGKNLPYGEAGQWIGPLGSLSARDGELVLFIGRYRDKEGEFIDGIFAGNWEGVRTLAVEGPVTDSASDSDRLITQFNGFIYAPDGTVYFNSPVGDDSLWQGAAPGSSVSRLQEGQGLEDLGDGWRANNSGDLVLVGATKDGAVFMVDDARWPSQDGSSINFDGGVWRFEAGGNGSESVAVSGATLDNTDVTWLDIYSPTLSGADPEVVGFMADYEDESFDHVAERFTGVWKWDYRSVKTTLVAKEGDKFDIGGEEIALSSINNTVVDALGRMVFTAAVFTGTLDYIGLVIRESLSGELELVTRTDQLPGSTWLQTFAPQQVTEVATNRFGAVSFVTGIGEGLWSEDPAGRLKKVLEKGDQLDVAGAMKTVEFIDFAGGGNTTSGLPSGLSDNGDLVFRVQFTDSTEAVMYSTFAVE